MTLEGILFIVVVVAIIGFGLWHSWWHSKRLDKRSREILQDAQHRGMDEPPSLHPKIDVDVCIGSGSCVLDCPEQSVLGLISGRGHLVGAADCIGHGRCAAACPVDAISLVFGTARRGVDLPELAGDFETSVPGIYIAGELGGMGLIANAFEQAIQAMDAIADSLRQDSGGNGGEADPFDVVVVGAGPAGMSGTLRAKELGLHCVCIDQSTWGGAVRNYPRAKIVMTRRIRVPLYGPVKLRRTSKEALLELWDSIVSLTKIDVRSETQLLGAKQNGTCFEIETNRGNFYARRILLAIGRRGTPRKLGVPGEEGANVTTRLIDPERWAGLKILVVGGGDVAVESALTLAAQDDTQVTLVHRGPVINRPRAELRRRLAAAQKSDDLTLLLKSSVTEIEPTRVHIRSGDEPPRAIDMDQVFVMIGGQLPTQLLNTLGIRMVTKYGEK